MTEIVLLGKKVGMTREFYKTGQSVPVTVVKMEKARIIQVIDQDKRSVDCLLLKKYYFFNWLNYVKPLSYYQNKVPVIKKYKIRKILLIGGFHKDNNHLKSLEYISKIKNFFDSQGFYCTIRINQDPDEDFLIMSNSKFFIPSGGGFSRVIKNIVKMKGGVIIDSDTI